VFAILDADPIEAFHAASLAANGLGSGKHFPSACHNYLKNRVNALL
jgi:hypothetical protein